MKMVLNLPPFDTVGIKSNLQQEGSFFCDFKTEILKLIEHAQTKIEICSPFIEYEGLDEIYSTLKRKISLGVQVNIIARQIGKYDQDSRYSEIKNLYVDLLDEKAKFEIRNYHYQKNYVNSSIHAKMIIIDEKIAYIGSGELRRNSFEKNLEVGVIITGNEAKSLSSLFKEVYFASEKIFPEEDF